MSFVEPLFLFGLLALAIPLLVHLINRRKAVRRPFPAMKFLLESNKRVARSIKVRQWLLMALRMGLLALLAFALAKPYSMSAAGASGVERAPSATVFVMDTSFSMSNADNWDDAHDELMERIGRLKPWDESALVVTDSGGRALVPRLTDDPSELDRIARDLEPTRQKTRLVDGLRIAAEMVAESQISTRRVVVISDFRSGGYSDRGEVPAGDFGIEWVRVSDGDEPSLAVTQVDYQQEGRRSGEWTFVATVQNFGDQDQEDVQIELRIGDKVVSAGLIDVEAGRSASHTFRHTVEREASGARGASVRISPDDTLEVDDVYWFALHLDDRVRVLLVNGEPSSVVYRDEIYFLERALNPGKASESPIVTSVTTREGLEGRELDGYDVVVLANVSHLKSSTAERVLDFVRDGGGLWITMGSQVDVEAYNTNLSELLPRQLRGLKRLADRDDVDAPLKITGFGKSMRQHAIFKVFDDPGGATLQAARVYSYMLLEPAPAGQSSTLLSYKDSAPTLLERSVGKGRVALFTTSIDLEWTDLATRTAYLPLVRRLVQYLARRATSESVVRYVVGDQVSLDVDSLVRERLVILGPEDTRYVLEPEEGIVEFEVERPGVYEVYAESEDDGMRLAGLDFSVNVDVEESDLTQIPDAELEELSREAEASAGTSAPQKRINIWPFLLFVVAIFLLLESVIGTRRSVLTRLWNTLRGRAPG